MVLQITMLNCCFHSPGAPVYELLMSSYIQFLYEITGGSITVWGNRISSIYFWILPCSLLCLNLDPESHKKTNIFQNKWPDIQPSKSERRIKWSYLGLWLHPFWSMYFAEIMWRFARLQGIWRCSFLSNYLQLSLRKTSDLIFGREPQTVTHVFVTSSFQNYEKVVMPGSAIEMQPVLHGEKKCAAQQRTASTDQLNCKNLQGGWSIWFGYISVIFFPQTRVENSTEHPSLPLPLLFPSSNTLVLCMAWSIWSGRHRPALLLWSAGRRCSGFLCSSVPQLATRLLHQRTCKQPLIIILSPTR